MRRCLHLTKDLPTRLDSGGRQRTWHVLQVLAERFDEVVLAGFGAAPPVLPPGVRCVAVPARLPASRLPAHLARSGGSLAAARWFHPVLHDAVAAAAADTHLHVDFSTLSVNVPRGRRIDSLDLHNVEAVLLARRLRERHRLVGAAARYEVARLAALERDAVRRSGVVTACSATDAGYVHDTHGVRCLVAANGVALPRPVAPRTPPPDGAAPVLLFVGALDYGPNVVAVRRLLDEVMPAVLRSRPDALLQVVGRAAGRVRDRRPWLQVHADVPDVAPFLAGASACVVPLTSGGGTRLKILEALAAGVPVVSTAVGAEGLRDLDGELLRVPTGGGAGAPGGSCAGAAGLADLVLELLAAPPTPQAAMAVAQRVVDAYAWSTTLAPLAHALGRAPERVGPGPGRSAEVRRIM